MSVGERLRRARLEQGNGIAELAASTKISTRFLKAIESDEVDELPGRFFYRNWAIQYANALSLDGKEIQEGIDGILSIEAPLLLPGQGQRASKDLRHVNRHIYRNHAPSRLMISFGLLLLVVVGCSGFDAWWHQQHKDVETKAGPPTIARNKSSEPGAPVAMLDSRATLALPLE